MKSFLTRTCWPHDLAPLGDMQSLKDRRQLYQISEKKSREKLLLLPDARE